MKRMVPIACWPFAGFGEAERPIRTSQPRPTADALNPLEVLNVCTKGFAAQLDDSHVCSNNNLYYA